MTFGTLEIRPHEKLAKYYRCIFVSENTHHGRTSFEIVCHESDLKNIRNACNETLDERIIEKPIGKPNILEGKLKDFGK